MGQNRELSRFPNAITVLDNGNVGIGTTSFSEGTQPTGTISIIPNSSVSSGPLVQFAGNGRIRPASAGDRLSIDGNALFLNSTFNANIIMATGGGRVGIGTASPWGKFNVVDGTNKSFVVQDAGISDTIELTNYSTGGGLRNIAFTSSTLIFNTGTAGGGTATERMRISSSGNVGIGTNSPLSRLHIGPEGSVGGNTPTIVMSSASGTKPSMLITEYTARSGAFGYDNSNFLTLSTEASVTAGIKFKVGSSFQSGLLNTGTDGMIINSSGVVTTPSQPAFRAYNSVNGFWYVNNNDTLIFDVTEYNIGNCYNTSNGRFTAPVAGVYQFNFYTIVYGNLQNGAISLRRNGGAPTSGHNIHFSPSVSGAWSNVVYTTSIYLNAGDYINLINSTGVQIPIHGDDWSSFSGYLVG
jgi:hypothetical protein